MFTDSWSEHFNEGKVMCWPFEVVQWPEDAPQQKTEYVVLTFDGTICRVYEYTPTVFDDHRMSRQPILMATLVPHNQGIQSGISSYLYVNREGETIAAIPLYFERQPEGRLQYTWRDGMEVTPLRLGEDIIVTEWNESSLYFLRRHR